MISYNYLLKYLFNKINLLNIKDININYLDKILFKYIINNKYFLKEKKLSFNKILLFNKIISKIINYRSIEHIINNVNFYGINLLVKNNIFLPRVETEFIIDFILNYSKKQKISNILELGSGIGSISLALYKFLNNINIECIDINIDSIILSKLNLSRININKKNKIKFYIMNWFNFNNINNNLYDIIISNPPYIDFKEKKIYCYMLHEPFNSIFSSNGIYDIEYIIYKYYIYLKKNGIFILEHGYNQYKKIIFLFKKYNYKNIKSYKDKNNIYRFTIAKK